MSGLPTRHLARLREQLPSVWVMGAEDGLVDVDHVSADNLGIGQIALDYLVKQGCRELAFITDHPTWAITRIRAQSFANAARDGGQAITSYVTGGNALQSEAYGNKVCLRETLEESIAALAASRPRPDGLFVPTDLLLTQIYPLLVQNGIQPQRDIRIISCDNEHQRLATLNPRPASIDIRGEEIGRAAMRQLVQRLQRPDDPPARVQVAAHLGAIPTRSESAAAQRHGLM
jgi:DNA-binding LacI/PurR family transcriptional regulator